MAKKTTPAKETIVEAGGFTFDTGLDVPAPTRARASSELSQKLAAMPVGASFLEEVKVPSNIKAEERTKAFKDAANTARNRVTSTVRRLKQNMPHLVFSVRIVDDGTHGSGVRVWRGEDAASS
jgi:hypothetical protein